ncbi:iron-containing redox enzyme family protein [Sorangium sp. So ce321]|uniref:iron-containing redox enzyme family protein n=1 Tax=Sorangium sp. So ce321 TaxID=3133300 RepID=UPI003F5D81C0
MELATNIEPRPGAVVSEVEQRLGHLMMRHHPFFQRADAKDPRFLRTMLQLGFEFSEVVGRYLTLLAHRLWDTNKPVVSILVSQVHDELGRGKFTDDGHPNLYRDMVEGLEAWADGAAMEFMREPQKRLIQELKQCLGSDDVDKSLGAYVGTEIIASDITVHISQVMGRLGLSEGAMRWSQCHDVVELEHVQGIYEVPRHLPRDPERLRQFWGAAEEMMRAMWRYFDALNRFSFA